MGFARGHQYDIDVREFLITSRNEVIRRTLDEKIRKFVKDRVIGGWEKFQSRDEGSFDFRANVIKDFVSRRISYEPTQKQDPWQFPDETLAVKNGDCEDRALLIASLMIASGISSYNVRVALGRMKFTDRKGHTFTGDHVWVMYKTCLLYTSDAADERSSVDLGGRRIIKKKKSKKYHAHTSK